MKLKTVLAAFAAMVTMGVNAQSWVASEVGAGNYYLYNVGKGQFLTRGNGYGTQASTGFNALTVTFEEYDGAYKLRNNVNGDGYGFERLGDPVIYADQSRGKNSTWTFTKVADASNGPVYTIVSKDNHGGGAGSYMTASADNTIVGPADAVTDDYGHWQIFQSLITNNMPVANVNGWTVSQTPSNFDNGNICAEFWNASGASIKQTVNNLPAGNYELIAVALTREGMTATLNAGINTKNIATVGTSTVNNRTQANTWFNGGNGVNRLEFTHAGGNLEIGLTADNTTGDHWLVWRSFVLLYKGVDLSALKEALQAQIDAVPALQGTTTAAAYNAAKNYADGIDMDALTTEEAISNASTELSNRVDAAKALQANYARYNTIKTSATTIATGLDTTTPDAALDAATTNDAVEAAIASLRAAFLAELPNVTIPKDPGYIDVTAVMVDNAGVRQNTDFWTIEGTPNTSYSWGKCANNECEFYQQNFKFYQTLALSTGTWEFGVTGFHRAGNHNTNFYAGVDKILIPGVANTVVNSMAQAETYFNDGNGKVALKFLIETAGDVEIGIDNQDTETDKWTIFRDFTLKYYGALDYSIYQNRLAELATEAATVEGTVPAAAYTALNNVVTTNNTTHANKAAYIEAIETVENAIATAKALQGAYEEYNTVKAKVEAMKSVEGYTETTSGATSTLTTDIATVDEAVAAATTADAIADQVTDLRAAGKTFLAGVRSDGEHAFDITFLITNPGFDNNNTEGWEKTFTPNDQWSGLNTRIQCNEFYQSTFDFYQTLTGMPKGNYELKVQAFQRPGWAADVYAGYLAGTSKATSVIYINEGETTINHFGAGVIDNVFGHTLNGGNLSDLGAGYDVVILDKAGTPMYGPQMMETAALWFSEGYYDNTVLTAVEGDLKLGFKSTAAAAAGDWTIFDNFRLYYYGQSINVAMDEAVAFSALADIEGANVTMARNGKASYNTVALPFDLTEAQVKAVFGDGVEVYSFSDEGDANNTTVNFNKTATAIQANVPVLVKATQTSTQIEVDNVTVKAGEAKVEGNNYDFVGNYGGPVTIAEGDYFISGDKLYKSTGATTIKGFRAYLKDKTGGQSNVKMYIGGIETAISEINADAAAEEQGAIFNLAGQRVNKAQKGIYVIKGKKVLVK